MKAIVTVKLPRNPAHDPHDKKRSICPLVEHDKLQLFEPRICTDATGSHHSYVAEGADEEEILREASYRFGHVTRIEVIAE